MKKFTKVVYQCDFCGLEHEDEEFMLTHELCCIENPINQPCGKCSNHIIGVGCAAQMNMDIVGGRILCFKYKKGNPVVPDNFTVELLNYLSSMDSERAIKNLEAEPEEPTE